MPSSSGVAVRGRDTVRVCPSRRTNAAAGGPSLSTATPLGQGGIGEGHRCYPETATGSGG